jgi:hypothetical protein
VADRVCRLLDRRAAGHDGLDCSPGLGGRRRLPGAGDTSFNPGPRSTDNHCVSPEGVDANQLLGISEPLFLPGACGDVIDAGEFYVPLGPGWLTMNTFWETTRADYTPSAPTPLRDFLSKVRSMIYIVDPGTSHERTYHYTAQNIIDLHTMHDFFPQTGPDWPVALFLPKLPPLPPGHHHLSTSIEVSSRSSTAWGSRLPTVCLPESRGCRCARSRSYPGPTRGTRDRSLPTSALIVVGVSAPG